MGTTKEWTLTSGMRSQTRRIRDKSGQRKDSWSSDSGDSDDGTNSSESSESEQSDSDDEDDGKKRREQIYEKIAALEEELGELGE